MNDPNEPLRLLRKHGQWALEVTKLVTVDRHVLRPERRRVSGTEGVVRHLKERCAPSLVREAMDLIIGDDDGTDRAFALEGEHWSELHDDSTADAAAHNNATLAATVTELRVELTTMRALHEALRCRLALLERRSMQWTTADYARPQQRVPARRDPAPASLRPFARTQAAVAPPAATPPAALTAEAALAATSAPATAVSREPPKVPSEPAARPALAMPLHADVASCLKQLLGAEPEVRLEKGNVPTDLDGFYVSRVIDSADQEMGAVLLDARGGMELGGRLLGFPAAAIEEQSKSAPTSDMLDAMNEVTNNLGGFINRANPELRVRVRPLEKFTSLEFGWLLQNTARLGHTTKTGGRLWIAAR